MRVLFAGTPEIAVPSLEALAKEFEICGILTNPDRQKGRKKVLHPSPVKSKALELGIEVFQPERLNSEFYDEIRALKPDILVFFAFGKIFKPEFLEIFPMGGVNIHPSLLPIYRGPSPINAAILNGDKISGISIQRAAAKMDSGNILLQEEFEITDTDTTGTLSERVADMAAPLIVNVVKDFANNTINEYEQDESKVTFCKLIKKDDGIIDWTKTSEQILNMVRAYNPWPLAHTSFNDKGLNIFEAKVAETDEETYVDVKAGTVLSYSKKSGFLVKTGDGVIWLTTLQLQSKKVLDYKSFNNGVQNFVGALLG